MILLGIVGVVILVLVIAFIANTIDDIKETIVKSPLKRLWIW